MDILLAETDTDIAACFPVMASLRPELDEDSFVGRVRLQQAAGYRLVFLSMESIPVAVAGFWVRENLAWGRHLHVDDLVTLATHRSQGLGATMLAWLVWFAAENGCQQLHLDSGTHREGAHRFYEREGMVKTSYHFCKGISSN